MAGGALAEVVESNVGHLKPGDTGLRRHRLAGLRRAAGQAAGEAAGAWSR